MRVAGVATIEQANQYLTNDYLVWWERELTVEAANPDDPHRPLEKGHNLAAAFSHVDLRQVRNDYTFRWESRVYQIEQKAVVRGLRGANVRVEQRLDGTIAARSDEQYLLVCECAPTHQQKARVETSPTKPKRTGRQGSDWNKKFGLKKGPNIWQVE